MRELKFRVWDKYKDNLQDFQRDYPEAYSEFISTYHIGKYFKDWLHDLLYKVE